MSTEARAKLQAEIAGSNNPAVQAIGQFLLQHLEQNQDDAGSILHADKTIAKSLDAMRKAAEKKKVGNVAVLTDAEGFAIVLDYFKKETPAAEARKPAATPVNKTSTAKPAPAPEPEEDDFDFDDLLL